MQQKECVSLIFQYDTLKVIAPFSLMYTNSIHLDMLYTYIILYSNWIHCAVIHKCIHIYFWWFDQIHAMRVWFSHIQFQGTHSRNSTPVWHADSGDLLIARRMVDVSDAIFVIQVLWIITCYDKPIIIMKFCALQ